MFAPEDVVFKLSIAGIEDLLSQLELVIPSSATFFVYTPDNRDLIKKDH